MLFDFIYLNKRNFKCIVWLQYLNYFIFRFSLVFYLSYDLKFQRNPMRVRYGIEYK